MKFLLGLVGTLILGFIAHYFLPYWSLALVGGIIGALVGGKGWEGFLYGFAGGILLWGGKVFWIDTINESILSQQLGELLTTGKVGLLMLTTLVGGLLGGLGGMTGALGREMLMPPKKKRYRYNKYKGYVR